MGREDGRGEEGDGGRKEGGNSEKEEEREALIESERKTRQKETKRQAQEQSLSVYRQKGGGGGFKFGDTFNCTTISCVRILSLSRSLFPIRAPVRFGQRHTSNVKRRISLQTGPG